MRLQSFILYENKRAHGWAGATVLSLTRQNQKRFQTCFIALLILVTFLVSKHAQSEELATEVVSYKQISRTYGKTAVKRVKAWRKLISNGKRLTISEKLSLVNKFFNQIPNIKDNAHWGVADYWATPVELLATNGGDCEDFALAKYFTLRAMGVPGENLRVMYVKAKRGRGIIEDHMVLAYFTQIESEPLILDNLVTRISSVSKRRDLSTTYSFNDEGFWSAKDKGRGARLADSRNLKRWDDLLARIDGGVLNRTDQRLLAAGPKSVTLGVHTAKLTQTNK